VNWINYTDGLSALFEQGGMVLWVILVVSIYMWILLVERYWFHWMQMPGLQERLYDDWLSQPAMLTPSLTFRRIETLATDIRTEASRNMLALQALVVILPLLGLLGTVSGMIKVFEVITIFGTGNTRGMAAGISEALVTTMAGLFTALSGLYFVSDLERRADDCARRFESKLVEDQ
jgi:biopolymer transport protein ExbB